MKSIADLRKEYMQGTLDEADVPTTPMPFFKLWFDQALNAGLAEPNAMALSTVNESGRPSSRIVLIKGVSDVGFTFFTNYQSKKGHELANNSQASLLFYWAELERQVRIEGSIEKVSEARSDEYFKSRPSGSRLGAWASPQSQVLLDRQALESLLTDAQQEQGEALERPPHWGGYCLKPDYIEFWQGRPSRLHDRLAFDQRDKTDWQLIRLAP